MKRMICVVSAALLLCGCESKTPYIPRETASAAVSVGDYEYKESAISTSSGSRFQITSRGFQYMSGDVMTVYTPSRGKSYQVCYDPLCSHGMGSDCFYQFMVYGSVAEQKGERLYWYDHDVNLENPGKLVENDMHYRICTTDLTGQDFEILYRNSGNYISEIALGEDRIYFTEQIGDRLCVLHFVDYNGRNLKTQPYTEGEELVVSAFACMGNEIYYIANGILSVCDAELENSRVLAEIGEAPLYADARNEKLYYTRSDTVFCYDPAGDTTEVILSAEDGMVITGLCVTDAGIYYQKLPENITTASLYADYIACLEEGYSKLYRYDFATGEITETAIPAGLYIFSYTVADDLVFGIRCHENSPNRTVNGRGHFCWNTKTGEVTDVP
ncbi:MAG: hypothetical protein IJX93_11075 [Clostridia bacterium]|nr:hypothetical protein [Clostridia bacterium]